MLIDVLIPVYKPGDELRELLRRLQEQNKKVNRIILMHTADGMDMTWISEYQNVDEYSVSPEEFDHGGTRDQGMQMSQADVVVCLTQDALPLNRELIEALISELEDEEIAVAYARQLPNRECDILERITRKFNYPDKSRVKSKDDLDELGIKTFFCSNVCAAYKKDVYDKLGGFEKKTIFNEDMIYAARAIKAGYKIAYSAEAQVIHSHNYTNRQQFTRNFDMAVSQAQHPDIFADVKSEKEGIRMVKTTASYLWETGHPFKIIQLFAKSAAKYAGYKMGLNYTKLPRCVVEKCTMNPRYWGNAKKPS